MPAKRFAGYDDSRMLTKPRTQLRQSTPVEMVKEQISNHDRVVGPAAKREDVSFKPLRMHRPVGWPAAQIEPGQHGRNSGQGPTKFTRTSTYFQYLITGKAPRPQDFLKPGTAPKQTIDDEQIAARGTGGRGVFG